MYQEWTKKDASFSNDFSFIPWCLSPKKGHEQQGTDTLDPELLKCFLLQQSPWGYWIWLSCSRFHILPYKLNQEHISSQRSTQSRYTFLASSAGNGARILKACLLQPSAFGWSSCAHGRGGGRGHGGKFHPCLSQTKPKWTPFNIVSFLRDLVFISSLKQPVILLGVSGYLTLFPQCWKCFKCDKWIQIGTCVKDTVGSLLVALWEDTNAGLIRKSILLSGWLITILCWRWENSSVMTR